MNMACALTPSLPARRCPSMSEMSGSENIPHCPCVAMRLIESSHNPLSSGYAYDSVPLGRAMMERDMHLFWLPPLTWGCHHPPYLTGTPLHHLLALCHHHPTLPSPWATPRSTLACAHTHACLIGAPSTHFPVDFYRFLVHNSWGPTIIPFCHGPMLHTLHVRPIPTTFLPAYAGILFTHG